MGWINVLICVIAMFRLRGTNLFIPALIIAIVSFWSFGVMWNYKDKPMLAPNYATTINMIVTFCGIGFLIYSFFI